MLPRFPENLNEAELQKYLTIVVNKLLEKLQEKNPQLKLSDKAKEDLTQGIVNTMMQNRNGQVEKDEITDPKFIHKLALCLVTAATLEKSPNQSLLKDLKDIFQPNHDPNLKKTLSPDAQKNLQACYDDLMKELENTGLKPKPSPEKKEQEQKTIAEILSEHPPMVGMVEASEGVAEVEFFVNGMLIGSFPGVEDWSPYEETSEAETVLDNKYNTKSDPFGIGAAIEGAEEELCDLCEEAQMDFRSSESMSMKPHHGE